MCIRDRSREHAEKTRQSIKKTRTTQIDLANRVQKLVDCRTKDASRRELYIVAVSYTHLKKVNFGFGRFGPPVQGAKCDKSQN